MPTIDLDDETYQRVRLVARLLNEPMDIVVRNLLDRLLADEVEPFVVRRAHKKLKTVSGSRQSSTTALDDPDVMREVPIFKNYKGHRIEGIYSPLTHEVHLLTEPWADVLFRSPTAAAVAVVEHFAGHYRASTNTNGRKFWKATETGGPLGSLIKERSGRAANPS